MRMTENYMFVMAPLEFFERAIIKELENCIAIEGENWQKLS